MANEQNLIPNSERSPSELRAQTQKGGIASGEARRRKRDLRKALETLLEKDYTDTDGTVMAMAEALALKQIEKALKGDTKAFEVVRDTVGQKPTEKVEISSRAEQQTKLDEMINLLNDDS